MHFELPASLLFTLQQAETPGCVHEGGELGYALAVAYGTVFDSPELISVAVIGDGESETGPTAAAWQYARSFLAFAEARD